MLLAQRELQKPWRTSNCLQLPRRCWVEVAYSSKPCSSSNDTRLPMHVLLPGNAFPSGLQLLRIQAFAGRGQVALPKSRKSGAGSLMEPFAGFVIGDGGEFGGTGQSCLSIATKALNFELVSRSPSKATSAACPILAPSHRHRTRYQDGRPQDPVSLNLLYSRHIQANDHASRELLTKPRNELTYGFPHHRQINKGCALLTQSQRVRDIAIRRARVQRRSSFYPADRCQESHPGPHLYS